MAEDDQLKHEIGTALDLLKKRWQLSNRWQVLKRLLEEHEKETLQIAQRIVKMNPPKDT